MRISRLISLLALSLVLNPSLFADDISQDLTKKLDDLIASQATPTGPGVAVIICRNGNVIYARHHGMANLELDIPISADTVFDTGSISKQFVGYAIAKLADAGLLSLGDDVRKHLPDFPDLGHTITINDLLRHTSGIPDYFELLGLTGRGPDDAATNTDIMQLIYRLQNLNFQPGSASTYSNTGYVVAVDVIEKVTGKPFVDWAAENIFAPLGMKHSLFKATTDVLIKNCADSYAGNAKTGFSKIVNKHTVVGPGGLHTTAKDFSLWIAHLDKLNTSNSEIFKTLVTSARTSDGEDIGYGLGLNIDKYRGLDRYRHGGGSAGFRSNFAYFSGRRFGVFVVGNSISFNDSALLDDIVDICLQDDLAPRADGPQQPQVKPADIDPTAFDKYAGDYKLAGNKFITLGRWRDRFFITWFGAGFTEIYPKSETEFFSPTRDLELTLHAEPSGSTGLLLVSGGEKITGDRIVQPGRKALSQYSGFYYNYTTNTVIEIGFDGDRLKIKNPALAHLPHLNLLDRDLLTAAYVFRFQRASDDSVTGFSLSSGRLANVFFRKVTSLNPK